MMAVKVKNRVRIDTRVSVLSTAVGAYAKSFGADQDCLDSIQKGIYERQIIEQIELYYYAQKRYVGHIIMKIDWKRHQVLVNSADGNEFRLEADRSILEQLDAASKEIIRHVQRLKKECHVTKVETSYRYCAEYRNNEAKYNEAKKFLGHVESNRNLTEQPTVEFKTYVRFVMDKLEELEIVIER